MRRVVRLYTLMLGLLLVNGSPAAAELQEQLTEFVRRQIVAPVTNIDIRLKTAADRIPPCPAPQFSLPVRKKFGGPTSIRMVCGSDRHFISVEIRITGRYLVAARALPAGHKITVGDIAWREGRIDTLTSSPLFHTEQIIGAVSQRSIGGGQAIGERMLRRPWAVKSGQMVEVAVSGEGFRITSQGKVMANGAAGDNVRVRMGSGEFVEGLVTDEGKVEIMQ